MTISAENKIVDPSGESETTGIPGVSFCSKSYKELNRLAANAEAAMLAGDAQNWNRPYKVNYQLWRCAMFRGLVKALRKSHFENGGEVFRPYRRVLTRN